MLGTPRLTTTRVGVDSISGLPKDLSFDSRYDLDKFVRAKRSATGGLISHGLNYSPHFKIMRELPTSVTYTVTIEYTADGVRSFRIPDGVTSITVKLWGGGGAGGGLTTNNVVCRGGGGAGGQYSQKVVSVTPDTLHTISVGAYKTGTTGNGGNGNDSTFDTNVVVAKGGAGGKSYENGGAKGVGSTTGGVGDTVRKGGDGSNGGATTVGGAGGGGAGTTANGGSASGNTAGYGGSLGGGNGATAYPNSSNGFSGHDAGGGGGGGANAYDFYTTDRTGGIGAGGKAIIEYTVTESREKAMANFRTSYAGASSSNISVDKGVFISNYHGVPYTYVDDEAVWMYSFLDPIPAIPEGVMGALLMPDFPKVIIGDSDNGEDYKRRIHTLYDTFKVFKTGQLSISTSTTTYHNGDAGLVEVTESKFNHGLGYIPMFSPFVDFQTSIPVYQQWLSQWYARGNWTSGNTYLLNEVVYNTTDSNSYTCIKSHIASTTNKPASGAEWETYWVLYTAPSSTSQSITLNDLEDIKFIFGGVEVFNNYEIEFYATKDDLILRLIRTTYDWEGFFPSWGANDPVIATDVVVDYTIFYNRADEEFYRRG